jgi:hypothetical protein
LARFRVALPAPARADLVAARLEELAAVLRFAADFLRAGLALAAFGFAAFDLAAFAGFFLAAAAVPIFRAALFLGLVAAAFLLFPALRFARLRALSTAPDTAPMRVPTTGVPTAVPTTAPATAPPSVLRADGVPSPSSFLSSIISTSSRHRHQRMLKT